MAAKKGKGYESRALATRKMLTVARIDVGRLSVMTSFVSSAQVRKASRANTDLRMHADMWVQFIMEWNSLRFFMFPSRDGKKICDV